MGFDIFGETVRVLESGLPPLPPRLERRMTVPIARWCGERYGAVVFVRLWSNGIVDSDCAIATRRDDGGWWEPGSSGGGPWIEDPFVRPAEGWDGDPFVLLGSMSSGSGAADDDDEVEPGPHHDGPIRVDRLVGYDALGTWQAEFVSGSDGEDETAAADLAESDTWDGLAVRAQQGVAAACVAAIEVTQEGRTWQVPIESPCGAFIVGLEPPGKATLRALDRHGRPLADARGATEQVV